MPAVNSRFKLPVKAVLCMLFLSGGIAMAQETYEPQPLRVPSSLRNVNEAPSPTLPRVSNNSPTADAADTSTSDQDTATATSSNQSPSFGQQTGYQSNSHDTSLLVQENAFRRETESDTDSKKLPQRKTTGTLALRPEEGNDSQQAARSPSSGLGTMFASLCLVLGLFFLAIWMLKKAAPKGARMLPAEVVEVLGRVPLGAKQNAHLLRVGNKMVLVSVSAGGAETLTEVTDPMEVDRLAGLCQQQLPHSSTNAFKQIFQQFAQRGDADEDVEPLPAETPALSREVRHA